MPRRRPLAWKGVKIDVRGAARIAVTRAKCAVRVAVKRAKCGAALRRRQELRQGQLSSLARA
ncbi:hypothetical protein XH93_36865 [Bradyrhizobium sp. CCBAU 51753]|nr:hypothetical protein XH93_36865 [Bradyrhizobium sp. CCBAU 51753]